MFPINPLKIKQRFKNYFDSDKRIKKKLRLKTETIERECQMYSMPTGEKRKIEFRYTVTGIIKDDGTLQFGGVGEPGISYKIYQSKYPNEPVLKAINEVDEEIRKNLGMPEHRKQS